MSRQQMNSPLDVLAQIMMPIVSQTDIPIDIANDTTKMTIYAQVPFVRKEDIDIDILNNKLTLTIERKSPEETLSVREIKYGKFQRVLTLPLCITRKETVETLLENGILKIVINKYIEESNRFKVSID